VIAYIPVYLLLEVQVDEQPITEILGQVAFVLLDDLGTRLLIRPDDLAQVLRVELLGEGRGVGQVTEHDS